MDTKLQAGHYINDERVELLYKTKAIRFYIKVTYRETIYIIDDYDNIIATIHGVVTEPVSGVAKLYITNKAGKRYE